MTDMPTDQQLGEILKDHKLHSELADLLKEAFPGEEDRVRKLRGAARVCINALLYDYARKVLLVEADRAEAVG